MGRYGVFEQFGLLFDSFDHFDWNFDHLDHFGRYLDHFDQKVVDGHFEMIHYHRIHQIQGQYQQCGAI